jgi:signal transduction histidine kinase
MTVRTRSESTVCTGIRRPASRSRENDLRNHLIMTGHDLKSPLSVVAANLDMLRDDHGSELGPDATAAFEAMDRAVRRMTHLVEDLLTQARAEQTELRGAAVALDALVAEAARDNGWPVTVPDPLPEVYADPSLLRHVLDNLIGNAVKYARTDRPAPVEITAGRLPGGAVRVEVADRGIGIPEADRSRVFDAFHRSPNGSSRPGTGLGLAICKDIVERHGGRIGVEANPGGGSRFWFVLPPRPGTPARASR